MTKDEKELLLKDLGARLSYGVIIQVYYEETGYFDETVWSVDNAEPIHVDGWRIENIKPYLRPMSSMTEKEKEWYYLYGTSCTTCAASCADLVIDWLNKKMFDYRGLIEKGLALEALEGMYKY